MAMGKGDWETLENHENNIRNGFSSQINMKKGITLVLISIC